MKRSYKNLFLFSLLILINFTNVFAQKVTYKDETIYVDDQPYAIMKKSGGIVSDYSIRTLDNKEIMMVRFDKGDGGSLMYIATFIGSGAHIFMKNDLGFGKKLAKEVVGNDLIKDGDINPAGERRFLMAHNTGQRDIPDNKTEPTSTDRYNGQNNYNNQTSAAEKEIPIPKTVDRDRGQNIYIAGNRIRQDNTLIGTYKKTSSTANGDIYNVFNFYLPDGTKIAEARLKQLNASSYQLITVYDNKVRTVSISPDINIDFDQAKEIARYLTDHYYL